MAARLPRRDQSLVSQFHSAMTCVVKPGEMLMIRGGWWWRDRGMWLLINCV